MQRAARIDTSQNAAEEGCRHDARWAQQVSEMYFTAFSGTCGVNKSNRQQQQSRWDRFPGLIDEENERLLGPEMNQRNISRAKFQR